MSVELRDVSEGSVRDQPSPGMGRACEPEVLFGWPLDARLGSVPSCAPTRVSD